MVTREPEFDDGDRERLLALRAYQAGVCECGVHESLTADKANVFTLEKRTCPVCRSSAQYGRVLAEEDKRAEERLKDAAPVTPRPSDGRRVFLRQLSALEVAARRKAPGPPTTG